MFLFCLIAELNNKRSDEFNIEILSWSRLLQLTAIGKNKVYLIREILLSCKKIILIFKKNNETIEGS